MTKSHPLQEHMMSNLIGNDIGDAMDSLWANAALPRVTGLVEEWRACPGYEGRYEVSSLGRIRSLPRVETTCAGHPRTISGGMLNPMSDRDGYLQVSLRKNGKMRTAPLHRLIGEAFHGHLRNVLHNELAHLDGDRANARADNLKWVSRAENLSHRLLHGTDDRGGKHARAVLTDSQAAEIKARRKDSPTALAEEFGVKVHTISDIRRGRRYAHVHPISQKEGGGQ